jgi:lysophospholipase L1-like esterase
VVEYSCAYVIPVKLDQSFASLKPLADTRAAHYPACTKDIRYGSVVVLTKGDCISGRTRNMTDKPFAALLAALIGALAVIARGDQASNDVVNSRGDHKIPNQYLQVVLFGDSLTWSARAAYGKRYADFLEAELQGQCGTNWMVDVAACGDGGNTVGEGLSRIERDCLAYRPRIVVLSFGGNDAFRSTRTEFMHAYPAMLEAIKDKTGAGRIVESPVSQDYIWKDDSNTTVRAAIRAVAGPFGVPFHDRFAIFQKEVTRESSRRAALIRTDGVHLTIEGNRFFAHTLASLIIPLLPATSTNSPDDALFWLRQAQSNAVFEQCCAALRDNGSLKAVPLQRLPLQQCRSFARHAGALAATAELAQQARLTERLAAGFLAAERVRNRFPDADPGCVSDSVAWAEALLTPVKADPLAATLMRRLEELQATAGH